MRHLQISPATAKERYQNIFDTLTDYVQDGPTIKILSFGCSKGHEVSSLRRRFPQAKIYGTDLDKKSLAFAAERYSSEGEFFESSEHAIHEKGPYDIICAMSVLCRNPTREHPSERCIDFKDWNYAIDLLGNNLSPNGIICIYNLNYLFSSYSHSDLYTPLLHPAIMENGTVDLYTANQELICTGNFGGSLLPFPIHTQRIANIDRHLQSKDLASCLFAKTQNRSPINSKPRDPFIARDSYDQLLSECAGTAQVNYSYIMPTQAGKSSICKECFINYHPSNIVLCKIKASRVWFDGSRTQKSVYFKVLDPAKVRSSLDILLS